MQLQHIYSIYIYRIVKMISYRVEETDDFFAMMLASQLKRSLRI